MRLMEKIMRVSLVTLGVMTAGLAPAQPSAPSAAYPNTENFGVDVDRQETWFKECMRVEKAQPGATPPAPASCKAFDYYSKRQQAVTTSAEWQAVRACALAAHDDGVLAMLYANGLGVARNLDLATRYACRAGGAYSEVRGRVEHLQALQTSPPGTSYDQCDDVTSGYMGGICANIGAGQAEKIRLAYLARLRSQLPAPQAAAFDRLVAATEALANARGDETDLSGTARGMMVAGTVAREREWLREHLVAFEKGQFKALTAPALAVTDARLNRLYQALMAAPVTDKDQPDRLPDSTVTKTAVRAAQRLWLANRDAWVRFAAVRYPALPPDRLKAMLTDWRASQLDRM